MDLQTKYCGLSLKVTAGSFCFPAVGRNRATSGSWKNAELPPLCLYSLFEEQLSPMEAHSLHFHTTQGTESFSEAISYFPGG